MRSSQLLLFDRDLKMSRLLSPEECASAVDESQEENDSDFDFDTEQAPVAASPLQPSFTDPFYVFPTSDPNLDRSQPGGPSTSTPTSRTSAVTGNAELLVLMREVLAGQDKLTEQVSDLKERLCAVESGLSNLHSDSSETEGTTNRVASQLTVSLCFLELPWFLFLWYHMSHASNAFLCTFLEKYFSLVQLLR